MNKPVWYSKELGTDGEIMIAVDLVVGEGLLGYRRFIHPFQLDNDPFAMHKTVKEMGDVMALLVAQPVPTSRACAFTHLQEQHP